MATTHANPTSNERAHVERGLGLIVEQHRIEGCLAYLVYDPESREAAIVDPRAEGVDALLARLSAAKLTLRAVIDTHTHADHLSGAARLRKETGAEIVMSAGASSLVTTRRVKDGDVVKIGTHELRVLETPGHTPDSISIATADAVFTGDTLLIGTTGRTDFIGGDPRALYRSIARQIRPLDDSMVVYPGHDYVGRTHSRLGDERRTSVAFLESDIEKFAEKYEGNKPPEPRNMKFILEANRTGAAAQVEPLDPYNLNSRLEQKTAMSLVDVRSESEFSNERLAGAINIPLERIAQAAASIPADRPIVLLCASGKRASMAAPAFAGRPGVSVLEGGLAAWKKAGFPLVGGAVGRWSLERQVRLVAGSMVVLGMALGFLVHPILYGIAGFIGAGLVFAAITNTCGMGIALSKMPWNRIESKPEASGACTVDSGCSASGGCAA
ncbi:MAG: MBL fold metallo-hydrolase [Planctomycetes bacterium]|nr:MBL fold metallo-hydrolase [Planctomycetota bacterium]